MTKKEMILYNKRCAEFLGYIYYSDWNLFRLGHDINNSPVKQYKPENLKFHSDWNWIIEVLNQISSLDFGWKVTSKYVNIYSHIGDPRGEFNCECSINCPKEVIKDVIKTVNHFLIWYSLRTQPLPNYSIK
jgi:hypothetical protein